MQRKAKVQGACILLLGILAVALVLPAGAAAQMRYLSLATGSPGGVYFPLGGAMADLLSSLLPDVQVTAESTAASVENSRLVGARRADMGMALGSVAYKALHGMAPFTEPLNVRALFQMYPAPQHLVTLKGSGIRSVRDLRGRRVSTEAPGSGAETIALIILKAYGIDPDRDIRRARLSQTESADALKDRVIDAAFYNFAYPASVVVEMATVRDIDLVPLDPDVLDRIIQENPFFIRSVIPAGVYSGVNRDVLALGDSNVVIAHASMPEELAYRIVKTIFENATRLHPVHPVAQQLVPQNAVNSPIPLHPGAERYFREVGALR